MPKLNRPSLWTCAPYIRKMDAFLHMYFLQGIQENTYSLIPSFLASPTLLGPFQEGGRKFASGSALAKEQLKTLKTRLEFTVKSTKHLASPFHKSLPAYQGVLIMLKHTIAQAPLKLICFISIAGGTEISIHLGIIQML